MSAGPQKITYDVLGSSVPTTSISSQASLLKVWVRIGSSVAKEGVNVGGIFGLSAWTILGSSEAIQGVLISVNLPATTGLVNVTRLGPICISPKAIYVVRDDNTLWMQLTNTTNWVQLPTSPWGSIIEMQVMPAQIPNNPSPYDTLFAVCSPKFPEHLVMMTIKFPYAWTEITQMAVSDSTVPRGYRWP